MTDIDTMPAGREMDALILVRLFHLRRHLGMMHGKQQWVFTDEKNRIVRTIGCGCDEDFNPSTDIKAAWEVVEKVFRKGFHLAYEQGEWIAQACNCDCVPMGEWGWEATEICGIADTAPLAICRASLKAVSHE